MSTATITAKLKPDELVRAVALLPPRELSEFMLHFDEWQLARTVSVDAQPTQIADSYRLPVHDRVRVAELLVKNREQGLSEQEEGELDGYMSEMDRRLDAVADKLLAVAHRRSTPKRRAGI